jgi:hypothetical protein
MTRVDGLLKVKQLDSLSLREQRSGIEDRYVSKAPLLANWDPCFCTIMRSLD